MSEMKMIIGLTSLTLGFTLDVEPSCCVKAVLFASSSLYFSS